MYCYSSTITIIPWYVGKILFIDSLNLRKKLCISINNELLCSRKIQWTPTVWLFLMAVTKSSITWVYKKHTLIFSINVYYVGAEWTWFATFITSQNRCVNRIAITALTIYVLRIRTKLKVPMPKRTPLSKWSLCNFSLSDHVREFNMTLHSLKNRKMRACYKRVLGVGD